ncbi:hypothetical protein FHG87_016192 [Trinorchestia longiramus]|nr:hypothetical protein FHG87_016192 [Trinorchestia longiramus]
MEPAQMQFLGENGLLLMDLLSVGQKFGNLVFQLLGAAPDDVPAVAPQYAACNTFVHVASQKLKHHNKKLKRLSSPQNSPQAVHVVPEVPLLLSPSQFEDGEAQVHNIYSW